MSRKDKALRRDRARNRRENVKPEEGVQTRKHTLPNLRSGQKLKSIFLPDIWILLFVYL